MYVCSCVCALRMRVAGGAVCLCINMRRVHILVNMFCMLCDPLL